MIDLLRKSLTEAVIQRVVVKVVIEDVGLRRVENHDLSQDDEAG